MARRRGWIIGAVVIVAAGGGYWLYHSRQSHAASSAAKPPPVRPVAVLATSVARQDVPIYREGLGNVTASETVTVRSQVDGVLERVAFVEGQAVRHGDLLAQIDARPFMVALHQAQGSLARDQAALENDRANLARYRELVAKNLVSAQQVGDTAAAVGQAEGAVRIDRSQIESAQLNLSYARITAPIDGVTGLRLVDPGNLVRAGDATGLVVITAIDPVTVLFTLPEEDLSEIDGSPDKSKLGVDAFSRDGKQLLGSGHLALIDNQIQQATATIRLKAVVPNPTHKLWPSQFVKARLLLTTRKDVLVVPSTVVQHGPDGASFAYLIGGDQTVTAQPIEVDTVVGDMTIIAKGLSAGDQVVADGQNQLRPGSKVELRKGKGGADQAAPGAAPAADARPAGQHKARP